jgi:hypothetical protein
MKLLFARARYKTFPVEPFNMTADECFIAAEATRIANAPGATIGERALQGHIFKLLNDIRELRIEHVKSEANFKELIAIVGRTEPQ